MNIIVPAMGYLATLLLAISLLVNNDLKFRWANTFGCLAFIIYGILLGAAPIVITNLLLFAINAFYLVKIYRTEEDFDLLEFPPGDKIINKFVIFYKKDITDYFPSYQHENNHHNFRFAVLRDMALANIFVADLSEDGNAVVKINYTVPKYRDYEVGKYIFEKERKYLLSKGIKQITYLQVENKNHERFLKVMGFDKEIINGREGMVKRLV